MSENVVKPPKAVISVAFSWGYQDARKGRSEYERYNYFAGERLSEYREGWCTGTIVNRRLAETANGGER